MSLILYVYLNFLYKYNYVTEFMDMFTLDKFEIKLSVLLIVSLPMSGFQSDMYYTRDYILSKHAIT